jgi:hypothetical protein
MFAAKHAHNPGAIQPVAMGNGLIIIIIMCIRTNDVGEAGVCALP